MNNKKIIKDISSNLGITPNQTKGVLDNYFLAFLVNLVFNNKADTVFGKLKLDEKKLTLTLNDDMSRILARGIYKEDVARTVLESLVKNENI